MRYLSLFSGIEAASVGWEPLGWVPVAFAEIEKFPSQVLAHHWPHVPNLGDVTKIDATTIKSLGPIDLVVGGWPCTDVSVAGQRKGFTNDDGSATRSGLFYELARILGLCRDIAGTRWFVGENVPGLLSSSGGTDFSSVLGTLTGHDVRLAPGKKWKTGGVCTNFGPRDWGVAWRVLDAQYFGVPQRRRRVFIVGHLGDYERAAQVLLEPSSLCRDTPPRRKKNEATPGVPGPSAANSGVSGTLFGSGAGVERPAGTASETDFIVFDETQVTSRTNRSNPAPGDPSHTLSSKGAAPTLAGLPAGRAGAEIRAFSPSTIGTYSEGCGTLRAASQAENGKQHLVVDLRADTGV